MRDSEYSAYMLLNAPGFGNKSVYYIYERLKKVGLTVSDLFDKETSQLKELFPEIGKGKFARADISSLNVLDDDKMYSSYQKLKKEQIFLIGLDDERYPKLIIDKLGENAPPVLFCKGQLQLLNSNSISIVGSRDVSEFATVLTRRISNRLAENGFNVTSGLAKGVDTNAHIGALESNGTTIMVLSYGFNYLSVKKDIKEYNWEKNSLFISQFMPYEKFSGQNAMTRNKLVCALSKAVIVISSGPERDSSGKMSGTFDAGLTALKYKIPLFVLNPELLKPTPPQGNIDLIKLGGISLSNGSELIEHLEKIGGNTKLINERITEQKKDSQYVAESQPINQVREPQLPSNEIGIKDRILDVLSGKPLTINEIILQANLDWTAKKLTPYLKQLNEVEVIKNGRSNLYKIKNSSSHQIQTQLFT